MSRAKDILEKYRSDMKVKNKDFYGDTAKLAKGDRAKAYEMLKDSVDKVAEQTRKSMGYKIGSKDASH